MDEQSSVGRSRTSYVPRPIPSYYPIIHNEEGCSRMGGSRMVGCEVGWVGCEVGVGCVVGWVVGW